MSIFLIYLVAFIEGFSTLAVEIIAIRMATPIVGSSIILTSVFLGVILLALSAGYYAGGVVSDRYPRPKLLILLGVYLLFAGVRYLFVTFRWEPQLLEWLLQSFDSYLLTLFVTAISLFFPPVFIASQTLPLLTEIIPEQSKGKAAGRVLFASTVGSFFGSVLTSILLFQTFGVALTGSIVGASLFGAAGLVYRDRYKKLSIACFLLMIAVFFLSKLTYHQPDPNISYSFDSAYQEIKIRNIVIGSRPAKIYHTNNAFSSAIYGDTKKSPFSYVREAVARTEQLTPQKVLVIGAAGFVYPYEISQLPYVEQVDTIDIDPQVKWIAEKHFLGEKLPEKITFYPYSARFFVNQAIQEGAQYDLILVDAYNGKTVPDELTTKQFFDDLTALADRDRILFNVIMDRNMRSDFAHNIIATLQSSLGDIYAHNVNKTAESSINNFIIGSAKYTDDYEQVSRPGIVYTDNKRTTEIDLVDMFREL